MKTLTLLLIFFALIGIPCLAQETEGSPTIETFLTTDLPVEIYDAEIKTIDAKHNDYLLEFTATNIGDKEVFGFVSSFNNS